MCRSREVNERVLFIIIGRTAKCQPPSRRLTALLSTFEPTATTAWICLGFRLSRLPHLRHLHHDLLVRRAFGQSLLHLLELLLHKEGVPGRLPDFSGCPIRLKLPQVLQPPFAQATEVLVDIEGLRVAAIHVATPVADQTVCYTFWCPEQHREGWMIV